MNSSLAWRIEVLEGLATVVETCTINCSRCIFVRELCSIVLVFTRELIDMSLSVIDQFLLFRNFDLFLIIATQCTFDITDLLIGSSRQFRELFRLNVHLIQNLFLCSSERLLKLFKLLFSSAACIIVL